MPREPPNLAISLTVDGNHLVHGRIEGHWARRRRSSGCWSMNSSTAARNDDDGGDPLRFRNSTNCLTASCSSGVSELMTSARFSAAIVAFHAQYTRQDVACVLRADATTTTHSESYLDHVNGFGLRQ